MKFNFSSKERETMRGILATIITETKSATAFDHCQKLMTQFQPNSLESNLKPPQVSLIMVILEHGINVGQDQADKQVMVAGMTELKEKIKKRVEDVHGPMEGGK